MSTRFTIAGLMGFVLVASVGLAALRSGSSMWASVMFLLTCGVLALGVVGVACGGGAGRPRGLGVSLFGWGYLAWAFWGPDSMPGGGRAPTVALLRAIGASLGGPGPRPPGQGGFSGGEDFYSFQEVGHCLWGLVLAALGGVLAHVLWPPTARPGGPDDDGP